MTTKEFRKFKHDFKKRLDLAGLYILIAACMAEEQVLQTKLHDLDGTAYSENSANAKKREGMIAGLTDLRKEISEISKKFIFEIDSAIESMK